MVALLLVLGAAQLFVAGELEAGALGHLRALEVDDRIGSPLQICFGCFELLLGGP